MANDVSKLKIPQKTAKTKAHTTEQVMWQVKAKANPGDFQPHASIAQGHLLCLCSVWLGQSSFSPPTLLHRWQKRFVGLQVLLQLKLKDICPVYNPYR